MQELVKDSGVVLFFYPRANTPGCTKQACGFRDEYKKFQDAGYKVFGMSADKPKSQLNWKNKHSLPYSFLCDPEFKVGAEAGMGSLVTPQLPLAGISWHQLAANTSTWQDLTMLKPRIRSLAPWRMQCRGYMAGQRQQSVCCCGSCERPLLCRGYAWL